MVLKQEGKVLSNNNVVSQRDLNPCLSLERTEGTEQNQSDDDVESSDE